MSELLHALGDVLAECSTSMVPADARAISSQDILSTFLDPLLKMAVSGLGDVAKPIYMSNAICAAQSVLARHDFCASWVQTLMSHASDWMDALIEAHAADVWGRVARGDGGGAGVLARFADRALGFAAFDNLTNPRQRVEARRGVAIVLHEKYAQLYASISADSKRGLHSPEQIKTLLMI